MHAMKACGGVEVQLHYFLTPAEDGRERWDSRPICFTPGSEAPVTID